MGPWGDLLVVDDDFLLARATRRALAQHFAEVRVAHDSPSALLQVALRIPAVVLTDYELQAETAEVLIRTVAAQSPRTRVVLYSASQPERWKPLLDQGLIKTALVKPCLDIAQLVAVVTGRPYWH